MSQQRSSSSTRTRLIAVVASTAALAALAVAVPTQSSQADAASVSCTVDLTHVGQETSTYAKTFVVTVKTPFTDDRSTVTREDVFSASLRGGVVSIDWFKDVNTFDNIDISTSANLTNGRGGATGRSQFSTSSSGNHTTSWTLSCTRA